ncbi:MAG: hypothetical protein ACOC44_03155, partial [Promethearchaeia archaeon]
FLFGPKEVCAIFISILDIVQLFEDLNYIKKNLKKFVEKFELVYHDVLENWNGDISVFEPVKRMVNQTFLESR